MKALVRITFLLPITKRAHGVACMRVVNYLRSRDPGAKRGETELRVTGFTHTTAVRRSSAFQGWWYGPDAKWIPDDLVFLFIDRAGSLARPTRLVSDVKLMKKRILNFYREEGAEQQEIWCTVEEIHTV